MVGVRTIAIAFACGVVVCVAVPAVGQESVRTSWGAPDLQGVWDFRSITPLERPEDLADQTFLSEEEAANLEQEAVDRIEELQNKEAERTEAGGNIGAYNDFWMDRGTNTDDTRRTSLIVDPAHGRLPDMTEAGQARRESAPSSFNDKIYESYTELSSFDRCIMGFNAGPPMTPGAYNNNMQLFQTPEYVAVVTEMVHTVRIIPVVIVLHRVMVSVRGLVIHIAIGTVTRLLSRPSISMTMRCMPIGGVRAEI